MTIRILRRMLSAEFVGLILVLVALQALTYGIASSLRNTDTKYFFWVCLIAALIAVVIVTAVTSLGTGVRDAFNSIATTINAAV